MYLYVIGISLLIKINNVCFSRVVLPLTVEEVGVQFCFY